MAAFRFAAVVVLALLAIVSAQSIGGYAPEQAVTSDVAKLCVAVQTQVQTLAQKSYSTFVPVTYRSQAVNGVNYLAKVQVGPSLYAHIRFYRGLDGSVTAKAVQEGHTATDALVPF